MKKTAAVLVKIDKITKEKMKELKINWSEEIRNFIDEKINSKITLALAVALTHKILDSQKKHNTDTTLIIRKFRDVRYGKVDSS